MESIGGGEEREERDSRRGVVWRADEKIRKESDRRRKISG